MRNLRAAAIFLTRIRIPFDGEPNLTAAVPWFPLVGAFVGAAVGGAAVGLAHLVPSTVAATVAVLLGVLITGAFHEDGLADVADAFAGGWTVADRLRILKDPRHGSYGVAALCGSILLRIVCVSALLVSPAAGFACIVAAHALGRTGAVALMALVPTARAEGLGAEYARTLRRNPAAAGIISGVVIAVAAVSWWAAPLLAAVLSSVGCMGWLSMRKIGGVTGDVLGATEQVIECMVLVTATGLALHSSLPWT